MSFVFPFIRLRQCFKCIIFGAILLFGLMGAYVEFASRRETWSDRIQFNIWEEKTQALREHIGIWQDIQFKSNWHLEGHPKFTPKPWKSESLGRKQDISWQTKFTPQPWKPEYKGRVNLHAFEDWCGGSTQQLRKNLHFPLYPHSRTTVTKLAVAPKWTNYGLRIFGYLHPPTDGEYLFAVASDDNSEFWLSLDDSPLNLSFTAMVGPTGAEWAAPGEFWKYASQISQPIRLNSTQRYYFEILHKQNDKGTDHVEVAWRLVDDPQFAIIDSQYISLYTDESGLRLGQVFHVPQSAASHVVDWTLESQEPVLGIDMLREDPRDSLFRLPLVDGEQLLDVLPVCSYNPSYTMKGIHLPRYQGMNIVKFSYVYPNDYTRLTHMDTENKCFYPGSTDELNRFGFYKYMKMDDPKKEAQSDVFKQGRKLLWSTTTRLLLGVDGAGESEGPKGSSAPLTQANNNGGPGAQISLQSMTQLAPLPDIVANLMAEEEELNAQGANQTKAEPERGTGLEKDSEKKLDGARKVAFDQAVNWKQTFDTEPRDFQTQRSETVNLNCGMDGNLLMDQAEALAVVKDYLKKLDLKHPGRFSLSRVLNVEKRVDRSRGRRYLLELELQDRGAGPVRLSQYIYSLKQDETPQAQPKLCRPLQFSWDPKAMVHFVISVKNQARWVQQFITEMEWLNRETRDKNFNVIVVDYNSTDIDVEGALKASTLPRYQYLRLKGPFERAGGLQAGVDLIKDNDSIVFMCDLHIHYPSHIIDDIRKHCVKGKMAFAPILMRLNCGATRSEPRGFWEVIGFGLLGIYKSDLEAVGGMNTKEYKNRWGGEDWELLDRLLQSGLEVERLHLRDFLHYYHSRRGMWNRQIKKTT